MTTIQRTIHLVRFEIRVTDDEDHCDFVGLDAAGNEYRFGYFDSHDEFHALGVSEELLKNWPVQ